MASLPWKEAATIVLIRPLRNETRRVLPSHPKINSKVMSKLQRFQEKHDYELFYGVRNVNMKFFAGSVAFPGGAIEKQDFDASKWDPILKLPHECVNIPSSCHSMRLPLYQRHKSSSSNLNSKIAFRLCAIRELAEETGLFLSYKMPNIPDIIDDTDTSFADTLKRMGRIPALSMLYDWRCWLTPKAFAKHRYDTIFYIAFIDDEANQLQTITHGDSELGELQWSTIPEMMSEFWAGKIALPPPQLCELSSLLLYSNYADLKQFATKRMLNNNVERWLPIITQFKESNVKMCTILPGDSLYPSCMKEAVQKDICEVLDETFEESCKSSKRVHRNYWLSDDDGSPNPRIACNLGYFPTGQVSPITFASLVAEKGESKL